MKATRKITTLVLAAGLMAGPATEATAGSLFSKKVTAEPIPNARPDGIYDAPPATAAQPLRVGDLVRVNVLESTTGTAEGDTEVSKETKVDLGIEAAVGLAGKQVFKGTNPAFKAKWKVDSEHEASTGKLHRIQTVVKVRILAIEPNNTMLISGDKEITIGGESGIVTVTGYIQAEDIRGGVVRSDDIYQLRVSFTGHGVVTNGQEGQGFFSFLTFLFPF